MHANEIQDTIDRIAYQGDEAPGALLNWMRPHSSL